MNRNKSRKAAAAGLLLAAAFSVAACGSTTKAAQPGNDAPASGNDKSPAEIHAMPDGFPNFADKCDGHGHRVYTAFHGDSTAAAIAVITDPSCPGR